MALAKGQTLSMRLSEVRPGGIVGAIPAPDGTLPWGGKREPFALFFAGPRAPILAQGTYTLDNATMGRLEIFLVPVGQDAKGTQYQAVFS
jgi:hypothetical protein